jgi:hypothetical protein
MGAGIPDEDLLFEQIRELLKLRPMKTGEICEKLDRPTRDVTKVLTSNTYSFEFRMNRGTKLWQNI